MAKRNWLKTAMGAAEVGVGIATGNPMLAMHGGSDIAGGIRKQQPKAQGNGGTASGPVMSTAQPSSMQMPNSQATIGPSLQALSDPNYKLGDMAVAGRKKRISDRYPETSGF